MKNYYDVDPQKKKELLLNSKAAKPLVDEIISEADVAINEISPAFKMSEYVMYYENGNRTVYEKSYFARRRKCNNIMMAYWLTNDEKYLTPLIDYISYICDEFTWCLPAHSEFTDRLSEGTVTHVDLFQAETARFFAEIVMCVGDRLPEYMLDRMKYEVRRRIFPTILNEHVIEHPKPLMEQKYYWWESCKMNWATVCGAGCTMAALYFGTDEEKEKFVNRFIGCLDSYLEGIEDDGCCQEGMAYWGYGFSHFLILAQAVKVYTDGKTDYFKNDKVKALALFPQKIRMSDSKVASISDGGEVFSFKIGVLSLLKSIYDEVSLPDLKHGTRRGNVDSVSELLWFDENYIGCDRLLGTDYLDKAQWYISKRKAYSFAAKGGHNSEPHNHNDIGSFMITVGDETFISDLGCGEYVKETFMDSTRYTFVQNSSRGHSVPIINGELQCVGREYCAQNAKASDNAFELDIEKAYPDGLAGKIHRSFSLEENKVVLTDYIEPSCKTKTVTERIVTKIEPTLSDGTADLGIGKICFDCAKYDMSVSSETFVAHNGVDIVDVYLIDITPKNPLQNELQIEFVI